MGYLRRFIKEEAKRLGSSFLPKMGSKSSDILNNTNNYSTTLVSGSLGTSSQLDGGAV